MRAVLLLLFLLPFAAFSQLVLEKADKCYNEKNWQCAITHYSEAVNTKNYPEKNYYLILFRIGYAYGSLQSYQEAINYYEKSLASNPTYGLALWDIAWCHANLNNHEKAVDYYSKAANVLTELKDLTTVLYQKARPQKALKKYTDAIATLRTLMEKNPTYDNAYAVAGDASYDAGKYRDAVDFYQRSIELAAADQRKIIALRYYMKGQSYFKLAKYDSAMLDYRKVQEFDPEYDEAVWAIAAVYYNKKEWKEAADQYSKTIALYKGDSLSLKSLHYFRGYSYEQLKDFTKAFADYDAASRYDPEYISPLERKANVLYEQKKYKEAIAAYAKALEADKKKLYSPFYYARRARCYLLLKDTSKAMDDLRLAEMYDEDGDYDEINIEKANISFGRGKYYEAATQYASGLSSYAYYENNELMSQLYLRKGLSNLLTGSHYSASSDLKRSVFYDSLNTAAHRYLGEAYFLQKSYTDAAKEFTTCLRQYKNVKDSLHKLYGYRGNAYYQAREFTQAMADLEQADKLKPNTADYVSMIGRIAYEQKDFNKVVSSFTKAISLYPAHQKEQLAFVYYARGRAHHELKNKTQALADIQKAIDLVPSYTEAKTWLTTVKNATY